MYIHIGLTLYIYIYIYVYSLYICLTASLVTWLVNPFGLVSIFLGQ